MNIYFDEPEKQTKIWSIERQLEPRPIQASQELRLSHSEVITFQTSTEIVAE